MSNRVAQSLRITHVVDSLEFGGLERVVTDLAIAQQAAGHRVQVFSINETTGFRSQLDAADIPVIVGDKRRSFDLQVLRLLRAAARASDIVHAHNFVPNYYAAFAMLGLHHRPALVGTCHDMGQRLSRRRLRWLYRWSLMHTARVAMVGQQVCDRFVQMGVVETTRAVTVLNGVPVEHFAPSLARRVAARTRIGLPNDVPVIGCVGRLVALKNHALLLAQLPALLRTYPNLRVVLVGDGPLRDILAAQIADLGLDRHVQLLGARTDIPDLLPAFDIFALPSQTEGLSIALLEACASGLTVLASTVGGNPEIIRHHETGWLVPPNDGAALQTGLGELLGNAQLRARFGAAARAWVVENASVEALRTAYDQLYATALATR
jgi:glycosyltransferase involved in cell wall biosynthesis